MLTARLAVTSECPPLRPGCQAPNYRSKPPRLRVTRHCPQVLHLSGDASYLSPHVNLAEHLEGATKTYGVDLLLSGEFVAGLSPPMRGCCRKLDVIAVPGAEAPMVLYTYERHFEAHRAYFERFATGVECYLNGDWVWAREYLVWCYAQNPADRPAVVLLEYMAAKRFAAPKGWLGCRRDDYEDDADALRV